MSALGIAYLPGQEGEDNYAALRAAAGVSLLETRCIGCGCTDRRACYDAVLDAACAWMRKDPARHVGVCTCCEAYLGLWDDGLRESLPSPMVAKLRNVLAVAEELEASGWPVLNLDIVHDDMPRLEIQAGADLEPDDDLQPVHYRSRASATGWKQWSLMEWKGVRITWHHDAPAPMATPDAPQPFPASADFVLDLDDDEAMEALAAEGFGVDACADLDVEGRHDA